jgi:CO/xanthine dehydrogenase FAD-binding subunit
VAVALDATFTAQGPGGRREIAADDFFLGMLSTALQPDELLVEVHFPASARGEGWAFMEISPRAGDYALVSVAATLQVQGGLCTSARLVYTGVGDRATRVVAAEQALAGQPANEASFRQAAEIAARSVEPADDFHATAEYRRDLVRALTRRALLQALARCQKGA